MADNRPPSVYIPPREQNQYGVNTRIMLTAVISLFFVVVIVVVLHLYTRCVLRRQARRRFAIRQISLDVANAREPPKAGLDRSVIASLPIIVYKAADRVNEPVLECTVCLSAFDEEEMTRLLPNCKHSFHVQCIDMWLESHSTCPICRTEAEPLVGVEMAVVVAAGSVGTSESQTAAAPASKASGSATASGSVSRLNSFRRMLSRERSERILEASGQGDGGENIERQ